LFTKSAEIPRRPSGINIPLESRKLTDVDSENLGRFHRPLFATTLQRGTRRTMPWRPNVPAETAAPPEGRRHSFSFNRVEVGMVGNDAGGRHAAGGNNLLSKSAYNFSSFSYACGLRLGFYGLRIRGDLPAVRDVSLQGPCHAIERLRMAMAPNECQCHVVTSVSFRIQLAAGSCPAPSPHAPGQTHEANPPSLRRAQARTNSRGLGPPPAIGGGARGPDPRPLRGLAD
jgi:hypothetical protein